MKAVLRCTVLAVLSTALVLAGASTARADGGNVPSAAPSVELGVPYFGDNSDRSCPSKGCRVDFWRLPPLLAGDVVTVAWKWTGRAVGPKLCLTGGVDDFDWFQRHCTLSSEAKGELAGVRSQLTSSSAQNSAFLEFTEDPPCAFDCTYVGPYQFTVESIQHALGVSMDRLVAIPYRGAVSGKVRLSDSSPVPDGVPVVLSVRNGSQTLTRSATTSGGAVTIPAKLPKSWRGDKVRVSLSIPEGAGNLASSTPPVRVPVK